jgi:transcriptional regulator
MLDVKTKEKFLELRARGKSLRTIEKELRVGRNTLAKLENSCNEELKSRKAIEFEALRERYRLTAQARVERFGDQLERVMKELENRDLSTVTTPKLAELAVKLDARLQDAAPASSVPSEAVLAARGTVRHIFDSFDRSTNRNKRLKRGDAKDEDDVQVKAEDLVKFQIAVLKHFDAGDIDERTAVAEIGMLDSILNGIDIADLQTRLERFEALEEENKPTVEDELNIIRNIISEVIGPDIIQQEKVAEVLFRIDQSQRDRGQQVRLS